jgi:hypothetical protein
MLLSWLHLLSVCGELYVDMFAKCGKMQFTIKHKMKLKNNKA